MVERFNGRIADVVGQARFTSAAELDATLMNYAMTYINHMPQRALEFARVIATEIPLWMGVAKANNIPRE